MAQIHRPVDPDTQNSSEVRPESVSCFRQPNLPAHNIWHSAETLLPEAVGKNRHVRRFKLVFAPIEKATENRLYIQNLQKCGRARQPIDVFWYERPALARDVK